ncbi:serine protease [Aquimarina sp. ERC-38]|uniref:S1 family peptidase n=1 Tax=Aquimarina sp. ERC-38 TaxID=2949996 RepID=UPI00224537E2|nr:serine protease [Aquimarina sp. ERC-38]UZO79563.1 serine protease [Aquimarina sp. ERC-38]
MNDHWETYNDWLIFSVKENKPNHKPLKFRTKPLKKGEDVYVVGWSYKDTLGAQRIYEYKYDTTDGIYHQLIQVKGPTSLGGLSGSPVVDKKGEVIGLVTSGGEDENTKQVLLQATNMKNAMKFISELK